MGFNGPYVLVKELRSRSSNKPCGLVIVAVALEIDNDYWVSLVEAGSFMVGILQDHSLEYIKLVVDDLEPKPTLLSLLADPFPPKASRSICSQCLQEG